MDTAPALDTPPAPPPLRPDTQLLDAAQRQLDGLRTAIDTRLADLEAALTDPSRLPSLQPLIVDLARLATSEAQTAATRACLQVKADADAALFEEQSRTSTVIEAERKTAWELRRALEKAQKKIEELEVEKHTVIQTARDQGQLVEAERTARIELDRTITRLEKQLEESKELLDASRESNRELADEHAQVCQEVAGLQKQLKEAAERLAQEQASVWSLGRDKTAAVARVAELQLELEQAVQRIETERRQTSVIAEERAAASTRLAALERSLAEARRDTDEVIRRLARETETFKAQAAELAEANRLLNETRQELEGERQARANLQAELTASHSARDSDLQMAATLRRTATEVEAAREAHAEAVRERDADRTRLQDMVREREADRARLAELEKAQATLQAELDAERKASERLQSTVHGAGDERATLVEELKRVTSAKGALEAALAHERARADTGTGNDQELRQSLKAAKAEADAARRDVEDLQHQLQAITTERDRARQAMVGFDEKIAEVERERDALSLALDTERMSMTDLRSAIADANRRLADSSSQIDLLRQQVEAATPPAKITKAAQNGDETELTFDEDQSPDGVQPVPHTGVRTATRYTFRARITVEVNGKAGQLINLSTAGCGVRTPNLLEPGSTVLVQLPGEAGVPCEGTVIWSRRDGSKHTKAPYRSGVKFTSVDPSAIEAFIILEGDV